MHQRKTITGAALVLSVLALCPSAKAQNAAPSPPPSPPSSRPSLILYDTTPTYPKNLWVASLYGSEAIQPRGAREQLTQITFGLGYYITDDSSFNLEVTGVRADQFYNDVTAYGAGGIFRHHLIDQPTWTLFADFGGGVLEDNDRIPPGGTDFNFTLRAGLGVTAQITNDTDLLFGARFLHLSNADQEGPLRNPCIEAAEVYCGVMVKL